MASLNKFIGIGNLGRDPEIRYMPNGEAVANISVGISEKWIDKNSGEKKENTEWVRVTFYRKLAEVVEKYLKKGSSIYFEGKMQTRKWTDKDGIEKYTTEIIADSMQMLGGRPENNQESAQKSDPHNQRKEQKSAATSTNFSDMDDDIPFANPYRGKYSYVV